MNDYDKNSSSSLQLHGISLRCCRLPLGALKVSASAEGRFDFVPSFREVQILEDVSDGPLVMYFRFFVVMSLIEKLMVFLSTEICFR